MHRQADKITGPACHTFYVTLGKSPSFPESPHSSAHRELGLVLPKAFSNLTRAKRSGDPVTSSAPTSPVLSQSISKALALWGSLQSCPTRKSLRILQRAAGASQLFRVTRKNGKKQDGKG